MPLIHTNSKATSASPVQVRMYDRKGALLNGYEQCFGDISKLEMLETLPMKKIDHLPINYDLSLSTDIHLLNTDEAEKQRIQKNAAKVDYTIMVFYSEWAGWYSKNTLKSIENYIKNKGSSFLFIKINTAPGCETK